MPTCILRVASILFLPGCAHCYGTIRLMQEGTVSIHSAGEKILCLGVWILL